MDAVYISPDIMTADQAAIISNYYAWSYALSKRDYEEVIRCEQDLKQVLTKIIEKDMPDE